MAQVVWWQNLSWSGKAFLLLCVISGMPLFAQRIVDVQLTPVSRANLCGDRQVVLTISLSSPLYTSDSLLLFEFAVRYNPQKLQFIAPLFSGTLAENTDYNGSGAIDSTTVRIWAFNVLRPLRGDGPLCGLLFRFRGDCPDTTVVAIAFQPEKNPEAKILYGRLDTAIVEAVELPIRTRSLTAQFPESILRLRSNQPEKIRWYFSIPPGTNLREWRWKLATTGGLRLDSVSLLGEDSLRLELESSSASEISARLWSPSPIAERQVPIECTVMLSSTDTAAIWVEILPPACGCVATVTGDTMRVVSALSSRISEENTEGFDWRWNGAQWELCGSLSQLAELTVWDQRGCCLYHWTASTGHVVAFPSLAGWMAVTVQQRNGIIHRVILLDGAGVAKNQKEH